MKRVKLSLTPGIEVEFVDRELALKKVEEWAERSTRLPKVVFGPEGCGKTAWLRQSAVLLKELGFHVIYVDPLRKYFEAYTDVKEVARRLADAAAKTLGVAEIKLASLVIDLADELIRRRKRKIAILADDVFQAIGLGEAAKYVKALLGIIEYPPRSVEAIVVVVATSEGVTRREIGRHRWADLLPMWNLPKEGFKQLYDQIPGEKPSFEKVWRATGGNPHLLGELYEAKWDVGIVVDKLVERKRLAPGFTAKWRPWLEKAVEDPDALWSPDAPMELIDELEARNLIVYLLSERDSRLWAGEPPPERDAELGIGRRVAWQTPLHREAVRRALGA
ncbi:MAG: ATP-binding protein [Pyrobaculum sp.]|uniref:P. aerophilum family 1964 protein n=2 Tax=Pyrobaculum aerophilum TaxID=13773 RepID=Q8ZZ73_PYRAE|nr:ATP-binding protein [Pyrobaculum aerophilum]AAL62768.1 P. aerophilum family 1964 protein [Pyrobaculum aerophilum str. IM2]HII46878.1 AAA family ATPase [Pyrobaculum aerophilum]